MSNNIRIYIYKSEKTREGRDYWAVKDMNPMDESRGCGVTESRKCVNKWGVSRAGSSEETHQCVLAVREMAKDILLTSFSSGHKDFTFFFY